MAKMEVQMKMLKQFIFHELRPFLVYIDHCRPIDRHVSRVVNVIVHSHSWLHQANGLLKGIPILRAQGMVVHEHNFYHFWVHYPVFGHCRVADLISSIAVLMNFLALDYLRFLQQGPDVLFSQKPLCLQVFSEDSDWEDGLITNN